MYPPFCSQSVNGLGRGGAGFDYHSRVLSCGLYPIVLVKAHTCCIEICKGWIDLRTISGYS
jgi:hypothetical protein